MPVRRETGWGFLYGRPSHEQLFDTIESLNKKLPSFTS